MPALIMHRMLVLLLLSGCAGASPANGEVHSMSAGDSDAVVGAPPFEEGSAIDSDELIRRANAGDAEAIFLLGRAFKDGVIVEIDLVEAVRWYRMAAEQGLAEAQMALAMTLQGAELDVTGQYATAVILPDARAEGERFQFLRSAAKAGVVEAQRLVRVFGE